MRIYKSYGRIFTHLGTLYSRTPEKRVALACFLDLHKAVCRKGADSERTAVATTRLASFARMGNVTKAGLKASKK